jgi:hypothetical protein
MRSRIEPMKKIARSLRQHREPILNYFRAQKLISSGVVEGLNNKAKVTIRKSYGGGAQVGQVAIGAISEADRHNIRGEHAFAPTGYSNWPSITHLASCPSRNQPTISSDESKKRRQTKVRHTDSLRPRFGSRPACRYQSPLPGN